jgi:dihydrofolate reductase
MIVSLIVAMEENRGIGRQGRLPWHLGADLYLFKKSTLGHILVMGRKTYQSIGRALPGRTSIVLSRSPDFAAPGVLMANSLETALQMARQAGEEEVFIIGGGEVFQQALPLAQRIYLTRVHASLACDTFFPVVDLEGWEPRRECFQPADEENDYAFTFQLLERA